MSKFLDVIQYYDRSTGQLCEETVMGDSAIKWAYQTLSGKLVSPIMFSSSLLSRLLGWYFDSSFSRKKIKRTIKDLQIDESEFATPTENFNSFNDFFTRHLKKEARPFSAEPQDFLSPADGRILVYENLDDQSLVSVKGVEDSIQNLFNKPIKDFAGGKVAVIRLCPADYHRYHFPCDGEIVEQVSVKGKYHSVNPIALAAQKKIFCLNKRAYTIMDSTLFGRLALMEVGAFGVAGIHQTYSGKNVERMAEKGYFDFGGSTVIVVFPKDSIKFSEDLLENSRQGIETLVKVGETIGGSISS